VEIEESKRRKGSGCDGRDSLEGRGLRVASCHPLFFFFFFFFKPCSFGVLNPGKFIFEFSFLFSFFFVCLFFEKITGVADDVVVAGGGNGCLLL
jgi:hypothetical protein